EVAGDDRRADAAVLREDELLVRRGVLAGAQAVHREYRAGGADDVHFTRRRQEGESLEVEERRRRDEAPAARDRPGRRTGIDRLRRPPAIDAFTRAGVNVDGGDQDRRGEVGREPFDARPLRPFLRQRRIVDRARAHQDDVDGDVGRLRAGLREDAEIGIDGVRGDVLAGGVLDDRAADGDVVADLERRGAPRIERRGAERGVLTLGRGRRRRREHREDGLAGRTVALRAERVVGALIHARARQAHRIAGLALDRRVVLVDREALVVRHHAAEAAQRIVEAHSGAADDELTRVVVDLADEALVRLRRQVRDEQQAGDVAVADAIALDR